MKIGDIAIVKLPNAVDNLYRKEVTIVGLPNRRDKRYQTQTLKPSHAPYCFFEKDLKSICNECGREFEHDEFCSYNRNNE